MENGPMDGLIAHFGAPISQHTRQDMFVDGDLVAADAERAKDAGITIPVAYTRAVYEDCVNWTAEDAQRALVEQSVAGREWDVLSLAVRAARTAPSDVDRIKFTVHRIARGSDVELPQQLTLILHIGGDDNGRPCFTIMEPNED